MKFIIVLAVIFSVALSSPSPYYLEPGAVTLDTYEEFLKEHEKQISRVETEKIASGIAAKRGEYPELCYLSIQFFNKQQTCGCFIWDKHHVVTSARCLRDCSEGDAANITVTLASASGRAAVQTVSNIFIPDGMNGLAKLGEYTGDGTPDFNTITTNNVAVIKLSNELNIEKGKTPIQAAEIAPFAGTFEDWLAAHKDTDGWAFRACGIGVIGNKGERARGVLCTDLNIQDPANCKEKPSDDEAFMLPTRQICLQWPDRDNNVCVGDFGGPVYAYQTDPLTKKLIKQEIFCTLVGSPNVRKNAPCLDGHITYCEFLPGPAMEVGNYGWIDAIVKNLQPAVDETEE